MTFAVRAARTDDLEAMTAVAARNQADPERFCAYVGEDAESIAADIADVDAWTEWTHVALDDRRAIIGWILADTDSTMGRVWWWGPIVDDIQSTMHGPIVDALFSAASRSLHERFDEHELAVDGRSSLLADFADRHGFSAEEGSVILSIGPTGGQPSGVDPAGGHHSTAGGRHSTAGGRHSPAGGRHSTAGGRHSTAGNWHITPLRPEDREDVIALHDGLFAGTHTPGRLLVDQTDAQRQRWVARRGDALVGYVATVLQNDGSLYVDFVGVDVSERRSGVGRALIAEAMRANSDALPVHLTVRESNDAARHMYAVLGFEEQRILVPFRRGFSMS